MCDSGPATVSDSVCGSDVRSTVGSLTLILVSCVNTRNTLILSFALSCRPALAVAPRQAGGQDRTGQDTDTEKVSTGDNPIIGEVTVARYVGMNRACGCAIPQESHCCPKLASLQSQLKHKGPLHSATAAVCAEICGSEREK